MLTVCEFGSGEQARHLQENLILSDCTMKHV